MGSFCPRLCVLPYSSTCLWYSCGDMGEPLGKDCFNFVPSTG